MRFHKFILPAAFCILIFCACILSFSIMSKIFYIYLGPTGVKETVAEESAGPAQSEILKLPIIMYHALIKDNKLQNKYFISPEIFENDLKYLRDNGYTAVTMTEVINYVHNGTPLPKKPIVLTFDDGYYNNYLYAYPLLKKYNQKAVISIIGIESDKYSLLKDESASYSHLTWSEINEMIMSGHVELQNHTYDMHTYDKGRKGCMDKKQEDFQSYKEHLSSDVGALQQRITDYTGTTPNTMTYPFGFYSDETEAVIKDMGFKASLSCSERMNTVSCDPECLYRMGRFLRPPGKSSSDFFSKILSK